MIRGAYYRIEVPKTRKTRHTPPRKIFAHSFRKCEPYVRDLFYKGPVPGFIDVLKLKADGSPSAYGRRYFPGMTYKSF